MKRFFVITAWEFLRHIKLRSFLIATLILPLVLVGFVILPSFYYEKSQMDQDQVIGCVELDTTAYCQLLSERLSGNLDYDGAFPKILIEPILPDTSELMYANYISLDTTKQDLDSLNSAYKAIKRQRRIIFQRPSSRRRENQLSKTYEEMISTREKRDLAEISYNRVRAQNDSLMENAILTKADGLLRAKRIAGYVVINSETFKNGIVEFHSEQPINFLKLQPLEQALQVILVEEKMRIEGITVNKIQELLSPIIIQELLLKGSRKREFNFMTTYLAPIIAVLLLFTSIFTSSNFLFSSIVSEKADRVLEMLIASVNSVQLIGGKILGLGLLGLLQILIWMLITSLLVLLSVIPTNDILFLTIPNAGLFILYYTLGYLFFGTIFVCIASLSVSKDNAHQLTQFVRILYAAPIALIIVVLLSPNSILVRFLSYIPILTPSFMVLRTPLGQPMDIDYYISSGIMLLFIILTMLCAGKIFSVFSIVYQKKASLKSVLELLKSK